MVDEEEKEQEEEENSTEEPKSEGEDNQDDSEDDGSRHHHQVDYLVPEPSADHLQLLLSSPGLPKTSGSPGSQHTAGPQSLPWYIRNGTSVFDVDQRIGWRRIIIQLTDWFSF